MDYRDYAAQSDNWYDSINKSTMTLSVTIYDYDRDEEYKCEFPFEWTVCSVCDGNGSHVNPSIDAHGISAEEFYEDPDFAEEYFSGVYDVRCYGCGGKRVEPAIDYDRCTDEQKKHLKVFRNMQEEEYAYRMERESERRMGC